MSHARSVFVLFVVMLCGLFSARAQAQITPSHLVDVVYDWPSPYPSSDGALQATFTVWDDPGINTYYYFAHFFSMGPYTGDVNNTTVYFGLQTNGDANRSAIFSVWNASGALGPNCSTFGNEGIGWHCLINYPWEAGHSYAITTQRSAGVMVDTWSASVNDIDAGVSTPIGQIFGQHTEQRPTTSWFFYEYYQTVPSCDALPHVRMTFSDIVGENGSVMPNLTHLIMAKIFMKAHAHQTSRPWCAEIQSTTMQEELPHAQRAIMVSTPILAAWLLPPDFCPLHPRLLVHHRVLRALCRGTQML